jgi:hypothetical protein
MLLALRRVAGRRGWLVDCRAVRALPRSVWWLVALLAAIGLGLLYADALTTGFLNDDYLFLEEARTHSLGSSLTRLGALGNYYRPLSRQIYFAALTPLASTRLSPSTWSTRCSSPPPSRCW